MNFNYCQSCFKKTPQTIEGSKFCAHCGKPFGGMGSVKSSVSTPVLDPDNDDDETELDDDDSDDVQVPNLDKLQLEIDIPIDRGVPVRLLARNAERKPQVDKGKGKKLNKKQFWAEYSKGASAIKPK